MQMHFMAADVFIYFKLQGKLQASRINNILTLLLFQTKYYFRNDGKGLLGHNNVTLILNWNVMPNMGDLKWRKSGNTHSFKLPTEYYATMKRGH